MKRKVVKQGAATLMVSLPARWAKHNKVDKGDEIDIREVEGDLVLSLEEKEEKKEKEIRFSSETESSLRTLITSAYRSGYDKLVLKIESNKELDMIRSVVDKHLLGFEIIKEEDKEVVVENITEPSLDQFDNIFSKVLMNIDVLFEIARIFLEGKKRDFDSVEGKIIEFDNFCRRVIYKKGGTEGQQLRWAFHTALNHGQRELYHLIRYLERNKVKVNKEINGLLVDADKIFNLVKEAYESKSPEFITKIHEKEKQTLYESGYSLLGKCKGNESVVVHHLMNVIRNFYLASSPLSGMIISFGD